MQYPFSKRLTTTVLLGSITLALSGCGGSSSDDNTTYSESYLQFYNGSPQSATTTLVVDDIDRGSSPYGDATSLYTLKSDSYDIELTRTDADDRKVKLNEQTLELKTGEKTLLVMSGDANSPTVNKLVFKRNDDLDDHFRLFATQLISGKQAYDLYMADEGVPLTDAHFIGALNYEQFDERKFWDGDSDSEHWDDGKYVVYLTEAGNKDKVLFKSAAIDFAYDTEYLLVVRNSSGALKDNLEVDVVINSSSISSFTNVQASAQFRVYNSLDAHGDFDGRVQVTMDNTNDDQKVFDMAPNSLTDFVSIDFGDYAMTVKSSDGESLIAARLITLNQGESKAIMLFENKDDKLTTLAFNESTLPQRYDHDVKVSNLVSDFSDVDLYFVRQNETIETAEYKLSSVDFAEQEDIRLPSNYYEIIAVYDDESGSQQLLDISPLLPINEDVNYLLTLEKSKTSGTGYKLSLLH